MVRMQSARMPVWFLTHGGGPMPLLGDHLHVDIVNHWKTLSARLATKPKAILIISGHHEEKVPHVTSSAYPPMLYDYYGFPKEAYKIQYSAPGSPELAQRVIRMLREAGWKVEEDKGRGFDHGVFVPLKIIFPKADIPVVQLSLMSNMDARQKHIDMGEAIASLRDEGVLVLGSGSSFHNMQGFNFDSKDQIDGKSQDFDTWLCDTLAGRDDTPSKRKESFQDWTQAPHARFCHPREEHLLPAHVALGAAKGAKAKVIYRGNLLGTAVSSFEWV